MSESYEHKVLEALRIIGENLRKVAQISADHNKRISVLERRMNMKNVNK